MGRYSRKDMIEFAKFAKSYQSSRGVEEAYQAYLKGERLKSPNWKNSPIYLLQQANLAYLNDKILKNRYGAEENVTIPHGAKLSVISWDKETRTLKLKTI